MSLVMFTPKATPPAGKVIFVGAGPGAADLITLRGHHELSAAEVVLYDSLVSADLLDLCPESAELIFVGKRAGQHSAVQAEINRLLTYHASRGRRVVRLKGGDPTLFGRLGEEIETVRAAGIPYEIVPGVTAACAAAAAAGISITHRSTASAAIFAPGHECESKDASEQLDWSALAQTSATICLYMGVRRLPAVARHLVTSGISSDTPLMLVCDATLPTQRILTGTLSDAEDFARSAAGYPAMILIGQNVRPPVSSPAATAAALPASSTD